MAKHTKVLLIIAGAAIVLLILFQASTYSVRQDETAVVNRFGKMDRVVVDAQESERVQKGFDASGLDVRVTVSKGLNFRIPFVENVQTYSAKSMTYISETVTINTFDSRRIDLSMFAQYRVINPALYSITMGALANANRLMDDRVYPAIIQTANTLNFNEFFDSARVTNALSSDLDVLNENLVSTFGVHIVDIGIYRKNFPQANIESIEGKMVQEIQKESEKLIAEGDSLLTQSKAATDRIRKETLATALETSSQTKADADAEAIRIYENAITSDLEFYRFINRMETFRELKDTTVFLDPSNDFIGYLAGKK
ncbi:MAG TPA: SPFH domain-containing protein [Clostridia bacterium]